jgi:putative transcriptional regulator
VTKKRSVEEGILTALEQALAYERGELEGADVRLVTARKAVAVKAPAVDRKVVARVREQLNLSQAVFAQVLNVSAASVKAWEQGVRTPDGAAARLLEVAAEHPEYFASKLQGRAKPTQAKRVAYAVKRKARGTRKSSTPRRGTRSR